MYHNLFNMSTEEQVPTNTIWKSSYRASIKRHGSLYSAAADVRQNIRTQEKQKQDTPPHSPNPHQEHTQI